MTPNTCMMQEEKRRVVRARSRRDDSDCEEVTRTTYTLWRTTFCLNVIFFFREYMRR